MTTILHISDLHFGEADKSSPKTLLNTADGAKALAQKMFKHVSVAPLEENTKIECVVITGDLTSKAEPGEFNYAKLFIEHLLDHFNLSKEKVLLIPGNHDVSWGAEKIENNEKYAAFANFYRNMKKEEWLPDEPGIVNFELEGGAGRIVVFGFNSCAVESKTWSGLGYINPEQFDFVQEWLNKNENDNYIVRLAALHHHVLPVHNYHPSFKNFDPKSLPDDKDNPTPSSLLLNASQLLKKCREYSISGILHGHTHAPYSVSVTNYIDSHAEKSGHRSRPIAIIGSGSPFSNRLIHFKRNHFQVVQATGFKEDALFRLWPYYTDISEPNIAEMISTECICLPCTATPRMPTIPAEAIGILRNNLNKIFLNEYTDKQSNYYEKPKGKYYFSIYDNILAEIVKWIGTYFGKDFGNAVISRYLPDMGVYKHIAIHRYADKVRHMAYPLEEKSITTHVAKCKEGVLVPSRNKCPFASRKRDPLYKETLKGDDQCVMTVPLNSTNKNYAYAVIGFARARYSSGNEYQAFDKELIENIADIIEDALRQGELADIAFRRREQLKLFSWISNFVREKRSTDILEDFGIIANKIYEALELEQTHGDALALFLPTAPAFDRAECIAECGFGPMKSSNMKYSLGQSEGLTGGIIDSRQYDYCIDHLNGGRKSIRGKVTSSKCEKSSKPMVDHHLSFVGVPVGRDNPESKYNKGALVLNIATPVGHGMTNYMETMYVEPLETIAQLLDPLIEGPWKSYVETP